RFSDFPIPRSLHIPIPAMARGLVPLFNLSILAISAILAILPTPSRLYPTSSQVIPIWRRLREPLSPVGLPESLLPVRLTTRFSYPRHPCLSVVTPLPPLRPLRPLRLKALGFG